jgi:hypothetical protein
MSSQTVSRSSIDATFTIWEKLLAGAEANQDDIPALEQYRAQLEAALADSRKAFERRLGLQAEAQKGTQELHALLRLGRDLADQFQSGVRLLYGRRSPKLAEFGMKALGRRTKAKAGPLCTVKGCPLEAPATAK